ncbi:hypothetical protein L1987_13193 [Smallanthus sonchifolius]|uniref:Uncharacterized protein n=1 Tax=Smallanthus sonchifolius TaxID=185202 RepID=A0ACB9JGP8_9ASTR|nr:hypothetical protein L1987_13193 [Smallanthus sonchifolius]
MVASGGLNAISDLLTKYESQAAEMGVKLGSAAARVPSWQAVVTSEGLGSDDADDDGAVWVVLVGAEEKKGARVVPNLFLFRPNACPFDKNTRVPMTPVLRRGYSGQTLRRCVVTTAVIPCPLISRSTPPR